MNDEQLEQLLASMEADGASPDEMAKVVSDYDSKNTAIDTPKDDPRLTGLIQNLKRQGASESEIAEEVYLFDQNVKKMEAAPGVTATEAAETPVNTESQSADGSLDSPEESKLWYEATPEEASERLENLYKNKPKYKKNYDVVSGTMKESPRELGREEMVYEHLASGNAAKFKEIEESVNDEFVFQQLEEEYSDLEKETQPNTIFLDGFATTTRKSDSWDEETRNKYEAWEKAGKTFNEEFKNSLKSTGEFTTVKDKYLNNRLTDFTGSLSDEEQDNFNEYLNSTEDYKDFRGERVVEEIANLTKEKEAFENRTKDLNIAELPAYQAEEILNEYNNLKSRILKVEEDSSYIKDWETQSDYVRRKYSVPGKTFLNFASLGGGLFISGLEIAQSFNETARMESSKEEANEDRIIAANVAKGLGIAPTMEETMQAIDATEAPDAAEQAAAEVKPDANSELMKWAINTQNNIQKDLAENYSKEIELDAIENVGQVLALTGDVVAQQLPNLLMMAAAKGKGQAVASLFGAGYSSRKAEFIQEESAARDTIEQKVEEYKNTATEDGFSRDIILNELEEAKNVINKDSSLKNLTSIAFGAAETLDVFSKFAFVDDVRKTFKYLPVTAKPTKDMAKSAVLSYTKTQATDQAVEQSINVLQNFADINFDGQDKSYIENYDHVAATSFIMGNGMAATNAVASARSIVLNTIRSKEAAAAVLSNFKQQAELESELKETTDVGTRRILKRKIKQLIKDNVTMQDVTAANFLNLSEEEQKAVFELDRESRYIRSTYLNKMQDPNLSETAKDILTEEAVNAYDSKQNDKRVILDIANKKVPKSQKLEVTGEGLATAGDLLRTYNLTNISKHQIRAYNNRHKVVDSIYGVSGDDISTINDFLADESKGDTITIDNIELTRQEAQNVIDMQTDSDGSRVAGKFLKDENGKTSLWVYTDVTAAAGMPNTFVHEYIHAYFQSKGIPRGDFAQIKDTLEASIDNSTTLTEEQKTKAKNRIAQYNADADYTDGMVGEEIFTLISDVTSNDVLRSEQDRGFWLTLGEQIKSLFKSDIGFENVTDFKTADDVKAFVNDFQKSIIRNKPFTKADRFSSGVIEDEELKDVSSKVVEGVTFEEGSINQEFQKYTYDGKKNTAPEPFQTEAAMAYEPLAQAVVDRISKVGLGVSKEQDQFIMDYLADNQNKQDIVSDLTFGTERNKASSLLGLAKSYNPEVGSFGGYAKSQLANRAIRILEERVGKQVTQGAQTIDAPESREIASDEQEIDISKPVLERLNIADNISEDIEKLGEMSIIQAEKAISNKDISDLKKLNLRNKTFGDIFAKRLFSDIKNVLGKNTKTKSDFSDFLNNNYEALSDVALNYVDFQKGSGPASLWSLDNPPSKKEFTEYYEAEGEKTSTKSDRKKSLNNAIARAIANDARIKLTENNPSLNEGFVKATGITLASKVPYDLVLDEKLKMAKMLENQKVNLEGVKISSLSSEDDIIKYFDYQEKSVWPLVPKAFVIFTQEDTSNQYASNSGKGLLTEAQDGKIRKSLRPFFYKETKRRINEFKNWGPEILVDGKPVENYKNKNYSSIQKPLENIANNKATLEDNQKITAFNKRNKAIGKELYTRFNKAIGDDKQNAIGIAAFLNLATNNTEHFNRALAEVVAISINPKGQIKKDGTKGRTYEWEHAMQQSHVARILLEGMLDPNRDFEIEFDAVMANFKLIGLDYSLNDLLKEGGFTNSMTGKMGGTWDILKGTWLSRYFNDLIAELGGIDPAGLMHVSGVTLDKYYGIDTNGNSTKAMSSKVLSDDFNKMLERVKGVKAEARYSEDRATKLAAKKGKFKFFVPYSAEDFVGLIYPTLGKGKEGDKNMQWYKENLLDPFARGISAFESSKQKSMDDWRKLKKQIKNTPADLGKEAVRGFTNEEAVRVYLWDQQGVVPGTLAQKDVTFMVRHVKNNEQLLNFAESVKSVLGGQYPAPQGDWLAGTLTTDLINEINTTTRTENLQEWQANVDAVYSKENLNKLKAIYGEAYVDALENILYRMKTGRNRSSGTSKIEGQFMNWVNDSVATVMFLNTRSALLQTISSINFMNWSDNNPLMAAKAFANQPQFWKDFATLMNSDFLKQRRGGLKNDVNADELAREAGKATNKAKAAFAALLKAGFAPTQIADSFAISIGGASFYRNRVNTYIKQGLDQKQAEEKAMLDFQENAEESQQSSRPDKVSMEQASGLGRVILAFANTPAQYTRLTKKAALDLINGRGDWKTNASKLLYYGAVQNIIFTTLQQALFALSFDDEEDEEEAMTKVANGIVDTLLRGSGVYGAGVATMKNMILEAIKQYKSKRTDYTKAALKLTTLSPPVDTKIRKLMSAGRAFTYKQSKKDMRELGIDVDNPAALAVGQIASALGNVPLDRAVLKLQNLKAASNQERETWEQIFLAMGYSDWQLGIKDDKSKKDRPKTKGISGFKNKQTSSVSEGLSFDSDLNFESSPMNKLERGVAGVANNDGTIEIDPNLSPVEREKTIAHEKQHIEDMKAGKLDYDDNYVYWNGKKYKRKNGKIYYNGKWYTEGHKDLPWEKRAYNAEPSTKEIKERKKLY